MWGRSDHRPECGNNQWACPNNEAVVVSMSRAKGETYDPFTGDPKEIAATHTQTKDQALPPDKKAKSSAAEWGYPPMYKTRCNNFMSGWVFPCSDIDGKPNFTMLKMDWLAGDHGNFDKPNDQAAAKVNGGHLSWTYPEDTHEREGIKKLFSYSMGVAYILVI